MRNIRIFVRKMNKTVKEIRNVTLIGLWINAALVALKLFFGYRGNSDALVADGYHSVSDFITDFIVIAFGPPHIKKRTPNILTDMANSKGWLLC